MIRTVYFDIDGVLSDLELDVARRAGIPLETIRAQGCMEYQFMEVRKSCGDYTLFAEGTPIRPAPMNHLIKEIAGAGFHVELLTALAHLHPWDLGDEIYRGKVEFLKRHYNRPITDGHIKRINCVQRGPQKAFYATPDSLLVDDSRANLLSFRERGGHVLHFDHTEWDRCAGELRSLLGLREIST
jgi:hypothetical protein